MLEPTRLARALGTQGLLLIQERVHTCFMREAPLFLHRPLCRPLNWKRSSTSEIFCEAPSPCLVLDWTHPTFRPRHLQYCKTGRHYFAQFLRLRTSDCDQYYTIATFTVFFYDFLLTLADEVGHVLSFSFRYIYWPFRERSNTAGKEGNHGVCREDRLSHGAR